jgi:hypothetical protein
LHEGHEPDLLADLLDAHLLSRKHVRTLGPTS